MAWARRTSATLGANAGNPGASWNAGNLGATPSVGDRIIAAIDATITSSTAHTTGVTDSGGLKWARDFIIQTTHNGYSEELSVWSAVSTAGAAVNSITFSFSPSLSALAGVACAVGAYSGLAVGYGLGVDQDGVQDIVSGGFASTVGSTNYDSGLSLVAPNKFNELIIGVGGDFGGNSTLTAGGGASIFVKSDANTNGQIALQDLDSGSPGSPVRSQITSSVSLFYMAAVLVYRLTAGNTQLATKRPLIVAPGLAR